MARLTARRLSALFLLALVALYLLAVCTAAGQRLDELVWQRFLQIPHGRGLGYAVTAWFGPRSQALMCVLIGIIGLALRRWREVVIAGVSVLAAIAIVEAMKYGLPRPDLTSSGLGEHNSFPSGHTVGATAVMVAAVLVAPAGPLRRLVTGLGVAYVAVMSFSVVAAHMHRPSDPVGSWLAAAAVGLFAWTLLPENREQRAAEPTSVLTRHQ